MTRPRFALRRALAVLLVAVVYFVASRAGLWLATFHQSASPVWPASGLAIAAIWVFGPPAALGIALGAFLANLLVPTPLGASLGIALGNTLEALVGVWIFRQILLYRQKINLLGETIAFLGTALLAPLVAASVGTGLLVGQGLATSTAAPMIFLTWWIGDVVGILAVAPVAIALCRRESPFPWLNRHARELVPFALVFAATTYLAFFRTAFPGMIFLTFPLLLWAGRVAGPLGPKVSGLLLSAAAIVGCLVDGGPFQLGTTNQNLIFLQAVVAGLSLTAIATSGYRRADALRWASIGFGLSWAFLTLVFLVYRSVGDERDMKHTNELVTRAEKAIQARLTSYEEVLRGTASLLAASRNVDRAEWHAYVESTNMDERFPELQAISQIRRVKSRDVPALTREMRREGLPTFTPKTFLGDQELPNSTGDHYILTYIEPMLGNSGVLGIDLSTEAKRREAIEKARDSGRPYLVGGVKLPQDSRQRPAMVLYLPYYRNGTFRRTKAERREAFAGVISAPFVAEGLFAAAAGATNDELFLEVAQRTDDEGPEQLLFVSTSEILPKLAGRQITRDVTLNQSRLIFRWRPTVAFVTSHDATGAWIILLGSLFALMVATIIAELRMLGHRADQIARNKTILLEKAEGHLRDLNRDLEKRVRDRTQDLEQSHHRLSQSEEAFRNMADSMPQIVWTLNERGQTNYLNRKWWDYTGQNPLAYRPGAGDDAIHPDDKHRVHEAWVRSIQNRKPFDVQFRLRRHDGVYRWHLGRLEVVYDDIGQMVAGYGTTTDVHEQMETQTVATKLAALVTSSIDAIISLDLDGNITSWNKSAERTFGHPAELIQGQSVDLLFPIMEVRRIKKLSLQYLKSDQPQPIEATALRRDRSAFAAAISLSPLHDHNGSLNGYSAIVRDVSDQRELKRVEGERAAALAREEAAMETSRIKSEFLANMSHEIRTPINGIVGMTGLLLESALHAEQRDHAENIARCADSLLTVINDILDFSKVEAGQMDLELLDFDLELLVTDTVRTLDFAAQKKKIGLDLNASEIRELNCRGDSGRIRQVLSNLIANAIKFTPEGRVSVDVTVVGETANDTQLRFEVSDTGVGIPQIAQERMFRAFTQADASVTRRFGGTGLGLSICKKLVELMKGEIGFTSSEGFGSTFWFTLRLPKAARAAQDAKVDAIAVPTEQQRLTARILVVEDNTVNQKVALKQLELLGYRASAVANGFEALDALRAVDYDLVLMDCQMPELDGYETTRRIRANSALPFHGITIIAMTANAVSGDREKCMDAGMDDYVAKPIKAEELDRVLQKWLREKAASSKAA